MFKQIITPRIVYVKSLDLGKENIETGKEFKKLQTNEEVIKQNTQNLKS